MAESTYPRISIVTASYNQGAYIEDCILSIVGQQYPNLEYIIVDGGSTDNTVEIIKKYEAHITWWVSEKDNGLYDALQRGFRRTTGEIMGWLNSDDMLHRRSLFTLAEIFSGNNGIDWLQGYPSVMDESGRIVYHRRQRHSKYSFYLKEYHDGVFIQQESTYWRRNLWEKSGAFVSTSYKYAGDFELWMRFFTSGELHITKALIGAFRARGQGQLSADNYNAYLAECDKIIDGEIGKLPAKESALLKRLRLYGRIKKRFPLVARALGVSRFIDTTNAAREIDFDFKKEGFRP